ncbi:MAG: non-homologous end-joining DNA ligase [Candidatus Promineifilaceae bacterium]|jgi:bifunctional non-homologous end joining protein LigD
MNEITLEIGGHKINIDHLDKVLFPSDGITKADLIDYYKRMAATMLPYMHERPVTMQRFPDGIEESGFYQKEAPDYFPDWINRVSIRVEKEGEEQDQITCENAATLVYLADQACITPHIWLSRAEKIDFPDKLMFDLDPPTHDFEPVRHAAKNLHELLINLDLPSFVMTTGSRGLHVVVPLNRTQNFDTVRAFAHNVAKLLAKRYPDRLTTATRKQSRQGKLFLDYLRNAYGQNSVAPYALRALPGAPVVTPIDWSELDDPQLDSQSYHINNIFRRLGQKDDPWKGMMNQACSLAEAQDKLEEIKVEAT